MCEMFAGGHETNNLKKQHFFLEDISKSSEQWTCCSSFAHIFVNKTLWTWGAMGPNVFAGLTNVVRSTQQIYRKIPSNSHLWSWSPECSWGHATRSDPYWSLPLHHRKATDFAVLWSQVGGSPVSSMVLAFCHTLQPSMIGHLVTCSAKGTPIFRKAMVQACKALVSIPWPTLTEGLQQINGWQVHSEVEQFQCALGLVSVGSLFFWMLMLWCRSTTAPSEVTLVCFGTSFCTTHLHGIASFVLGFPFQPNAIFLVFLQDLASKPVCSSSTDPSSYTLEDQDKNG